jgi:putative hydrolase of the HAD superfamily
VVKNVVFDLGGVVLDWNPKRILDDHFEDEALRERLLKEIFQHPDWLDLDRGTVSEAGLVERLHARLGRPPQELKALIEAARTSLTVKPDTLAFMRRLHARPVPLYCLSNMAQSTYEYLRGRFDYWQMFRGVVISGALRIIKPEPAIFEHLLATHDLNAAETVFIDDSAKNVEGARACGLHAVLFKDAAQCERELSTLL